MQRPDVDRPAPRRRPARESLQSAGVATIAITGLTYFASVVETHYPISQWFAWSLLLLLAYTLIFQVACVSVGARLLERILDGRTLPLLETWSAAMGLGLIVSSSRCTRPVRSDCS